MSTPKTYTLTVTETDVSCLFNALGRCPLAEVLSTFDRVRSQVVAQDQPAPAPAATPATNPAPEADAQ